MDREVLAEYAADRGFFLGIATDLIGGVLMLAAVANAPVNKLVLFVGSKPGARLHHIPGHVSHRLGHRQNSL